MKETDNAKTIKEILSKYFANEEGMTPKILNEITAEINQSLNNHWKRWAKSLCRKIKLMSETVPEVKGLMGYPYKNIMEEK